MTEQVIFKIDKTLKSRAMKKAKHEGTTYSAVLKTATQAYLNNEFEVGFVYSSKFIRDVRKALKEPIIRGNLDELIKKD